MHGPYTADIEIRRASGAFDTLTFNREDLSDAEAQRVAQRFYQHASPGLAEGALRAAVFATALLLEAGDEAEVVINGFVGTGRKTTPAVYGRESASRNQVGVFRTTLGARFGSRQFRSV